MEMCGDVLISQFMFLFLDGRNRHVNQVMEPEVGEMPSFDDDFDESNFFGLDAEEMPGMDETDRFG